MGVRRTALVDDGYQSGILAEGLVGGSAVHERGVRRARRRKCSAVPGPDCVRSARKGWRNRWHGRCKRTSGSRPSSGTVSKTRRRSGTFRRTGSSWSLPWRPSTAANGPVPRQRSRVARSSLFAAQVLARDLILSGREQEVSEIRDFISAIVPDGHAGKPIHGRSDDQTDAAELIRDRMPATLGSESEAQAPTMPTGLTSLIERTLSLRLLSRYAETR